jgi:hypothetical protein
VNVEPLSGAAVSVTVVPAGKLAEHVAPQLTPGGRLLTVPEPRPVLITVRECCPGASGLNVAVTDWSELIVTEHGPVPEQPPPDQPSNRDPTAAVAVNVTCVPVSNAAEHVEPQSIPAGELDTDPEPEPAFDTLNVASWSS